jgi:acyl-CoA oxidase
MDSTVRTTARRVHLIAGHLELQDPTRSLSVIPHLTAGRKATVDITKKSSENIQKPVKLALSDKEEEERRKRKKEERKRIQEEEEQKLEAERRNFDPDVLTRFVDGRYYETRKRINRVFANQEVFPWNFEINKEEHRRRVWNQVQYLVGEGYLSLRMMRDDPHRFIGTMEVVNYYDPCLPIKLGVHFQLFGGSLLNLGTERHFKKFFKGTDDCSEPGCFAMTELGHGSNVQGIGTTAVYDKATQQFIIHTPRDVDRKWWIGNAAYARNAVVFAQLRVGDKEYGVHAFVVPVRGPDNKVLPGVQIGDCGYKMGLNGVDNGWFKFTNVRIPRENLLNRFADVLPDGTYNSPIKSDAKRFGRQLAALTMGRVTVVCASCNVLSLGLTIAIRFAERRKQFGPPGDPEQSILDYTSHQRRLMPMLANCYALRFMAQFLLDRYSSIDSNDEGQVSDLHSLSAGVKALSSWYANASLQVCRECCGGQGYAAYNRFSGLRNDSDIYQTFEGDNTVLLQQVAKDLLNQYKKQYQDGGQFTGMLKYLRHQMEYVVQERNPVITNLAKWDHLRSQEFQKQAFDYRVARLMHATALLLQKKAKRTPSMFHAWNECLPELQHVAEAHIERVVLKQFIARVNECEDPGVKHVLKLLCDLYALTRIEKDIAVFSKEGYIKKGKAQAISGLITALCREVRFHALALVDGFGIPDHLVHSPLGLSAVESGKTGGPDEVDPLHHVIRYVESHYVTYP